MINDKRDEQPEPEDDEEDELKNRVLISLRIPDELLKSIDHVWQDRQYKTRTDFIIESVKINLSRHIEFPKPRVLKLRYDGKCMKCGRHIAQGELALWIKPSLLCDTCYWNTFKDEDITKRLYRIEELNHNIEALRQTQTNLLHYEEIMAQKDEAINLLKGENKGLKERNEELQDQIKEVARQQDDIIRRDQKVAKLDEEIRQKEQVKAEYDKVLPQLRKWWNEWVNIQKVEEWPEMKQVLLDYADDKLVYIQPKKEEKTEEKKEEKTE